MAEQRLPFFLLTLATASSVAQTAPLQPLSGHVLPLPEGNRAIGPLDGNAPLALTITLRPRNEDALNAMLADIQNPASPRFRKYLTAQQYDQQFGPSDDDVAKVKNFASAHGLTVVTGMGSPQFVHVRGKASEVTSALHVQLQQYQLATGRQGFAPTTEPSIALDVSILYIGGLSDIDATPKKPPPVFHPDSAGGNQLVGIPGSAIRARYATGSTRTGKGQTIAVLSVDSYNASDIQNYVKANGNVPADVSDRIVGTAPTGPMTLETALDIEMVASMAPEAKILVYRFSDAHEVLNAIASDNVAAQVTTSDSLY